MIEALPAAADLVHPDLARHLREHRADMRGLIRMLVEEGGLTEVRYGRLLSCLTHFTRDVQRHFYSLAGHQTFARRKELRAYLVQFADEEEWHWRIAQADLEALGQPLSPAPIEVDLWWAFFDKMVVERPFVRLGAAALLENLGNCIPAEGTGVMDRPFLRPDTLRFYRIHHNDGHGEEILEAITHANPSTEEWQDVVRGAEVGRLLHLGGIRRALLGEDGPTRTGAL